MKVLLLLAGRSQRFWPLTEKTLFPVCGKTLLEHQVESLNAAGIKDIILVGGAHNLPQAHALLPHLAVAEQKDLSLGMRGALLSVLPALKAEPVLIVGGNDIIDPEAFRLLLKTASAKGVAGAILASRVRSYFPGGYLTLEGDRIRSIVEKPGECKEPSDLVTIVAHVHNDPQALMAALEKSGKGNDDGYERALDLLFKDRVYRAVPYEGPWHPVKYPWHLLSVLPYFLSRLTPAISNKATIHRSAVIEGNVVIEEGAKVMAHASVVGPCFIGKRSVVANNALVRGSSIGDDCVVGFATEVKSSVLHSHVWTHMTYLGDSIVGRNVSFGAGSTTGNLRLDEGVISSVIQGEDIPTGLVKFGSAIGDNCRFGIRTAMNPGVKIGAGSFVSSGVLLHHDLPDGSFATMKGGEVLVRPNRSQAPKPESRDGFRAAMEQK
ncbi:MAG: NTP transferase domain-containing protein [Candidatus Peribacteraceae bacterium]|nr:NTP transferase domain-containing protein [Candidatus Peribacteraceae bacterium]MDD5074965.1 NTP transferase domain-containing protein [Candidatus Peribacteraceae bacterium]